MGTRADFYDQESKWLGSIAWDGYPDGVENVVKAKTADEFLAAISEQSKRRDWTSPERGWPWPWEDSHTTDYAYRFAGDHVEVYCFGEGPLGDDFACEHDHPKADWFPEYGGTRKNVRLDGGSGLIVIST